MANSADILACLGAAAETYANNKHRGGSNGNKGTRYEDYFLAVQVAEAAVQLIESATTENPHVQGQVYGFVDDARIAFTQTTNYFQLKNKHSVSWSTGDNPLATDFEYQYRLSTHLKEPNPTTSIVVSSEANAEALRDSVPATISGHTQVHFFPWYETPNRLVLESPEIRSQLEKLAYMKAPPNDVLAGVLGVLLMACIERNAGATVTDILDSADDMFPAQLRRRPANEDWEQHLSVEFTLALAKINGLEYGAERGFFYWSGFSTSGVFGSNVLSEEFVEFQQTIVKYNPKTLEAFESLLP